LLVVNHDDRNRPPALRGGVLLRRHLDENLRNSLAHANLHPRVGLPPPMGGERESFVRAASSAFQPPPGPERAPEQGPSGPFTDAVRSE
jgi:hypothetical protein